MSETALKFGPEWLRALSHGISVSSPPSSPGPGKFKLAEFRYGKEEMLALFSKDLPPPDNPQTLGALYLEHMQEPLAFLPMNPEEQRIWHRCVSNDAAGRGLGRVPMNGVGRGRGGSIDRGRGRGRGGGAYYARGISYDDEIEVQGPRDSGPPGMPVRGKGYERSLSSGDSKGWAGDRGALEKMTGDEHGGVSPRKDQGRYTTDNWRARAPPEEDGDRWKALVNSREKWGNRSGWREREIGGEGDWEDSKGPNSASRNPRGSWDSERDGHRRQWEEDNLPEWATENPDEKGGCFDASGAFYAPSSSEDDEGEADAQVLLEEESLGKEKEDVLQNEEVTYLVSEKPEGGRAILQDAQESGKAETDCQGMNVGMDTSPLVNPSSLVNGMSDNNPSLSSQSPLDQETPPHLEKLLPMEDDKLEHMESVADDLVAKLVADDEPRPHHPASSGNFISTEPPPEEQWFYTDPQGHVQGPFSSADMAAWCKAGYFKPDLLLRRQCDDKFAQLGDLTRVFGRVPFLPGPPVPPLKVSELLNVQKAERERRELLQAYHVQKQLYQQQAALRQQQALQQLQNLEEWGSLTAAQQQQLYVQHIMSLPPLYPPILPPSLQGSDPNEAQSQPPAPSIDPRSSITSTCHQQDPIQAFVAQMSVPSSNPSMRVAAEPLISSSANPGSSVSDSPLQKLLNQLQRSNQSSGVGNNQTSSAAPASLTGHPSTLGHLSTPKSPKQFDAIQSLVTQLTKIQVQSPDCLQQEELRIREEEQKRLNEARTKLQEMRLREERVKEEERRKELEEKNQRLEEELRRMQEEQMRQRREEEARQRMQEKRKMQEQQKREEEQKRHLAKLKSKQEEQRRREDEEKNRRNEEKRKMEEEKRKHEEEQRRINQEDMKRVAMEEERRRIHQFEEDEKRRMEEQSRAKKTEKLKQGSAAVWNNQVGGSIEAAIPSLVEIQKAQEVRERKDREAEAHRESQMQKEAQRLALEEKQKREANIKWASRVSQANANKLGAKNVAGQLPQPPVKSLLEIQREEERELKKRQEKEQAERAEAVSHLSLNAAGVWGSAVQSLSWANRASTGISGASQPPPPISNPQGLQQAWGSYSNSMAWSAVAQSNSDKASSTWNHDPSNSSGGFWESPDSVKIPNLPNANSMGTNANRLLKGPPTQGNSKNASTQAVNSNKVNKKRGKDDIENAKKPCTNSIAPSDTFTQWCKTALHSMKVHASIDIPTFVGFLADVESPYEVHDYIRSYLGDSKEVKEFAKQYLERRSKARNAQKERYEDDDILAPAPAVNPVVGSDFQEVKSRLKKGKKKMLKMDNSILGFNASSFERVNLEYEN